MMLSTVLSGIVVYNPRISNAGELSARGARRVSGARQGEPRMKLRLLVVLILLSSAMITGQTFRGTILGSVTDPSGAYVAGATVKVKNPATGLERTTVTSGDGSYSVPELPVGTYSVTVTVTGFQTAVTSNVEVNVAT